MHPRLVVVLTADLPAVRFVEHRQVGLVVEVGTVADRPLAQHLRTRRPHPLGMPEEDHLGACHPGSRACLLVEGTDEGWSIQRVRERVLKVATVLIRHARSLTYRIAEAKQEFWRIIAMALPSLSGPEVTA